MITRVPQNNRAGECCYKPVYSKLPSLPSHNPKCPYDNFAFNDCLLPRGSYLYICICVLTVATTDTLSKSCGFHWEKAAGISQRIVGRHRNTDTRRGWWIVVATLLSVLVIDSILQSAMNSGPVFVQSRAQKTVSKVELVLHMTVDMPAIMARESADGRAQSDQSPSPKNP